MSQLIPSTISTGGGDARFGHELRKHFPQDSNWINLNHGSHGTYPNQVGQARTKITNLIESAPDKFLRYEYKAYLNEARRRVAAYLHAPEDECVLSTNVTTAIDAVLRNIPFEQNDAVLCFEVIYDAVEKSLLCIQESNPQVTFFKVGYKCSRPFKLPMNHVDIVSLFLETIRNVQAQGHRVKLAVFDTITSVPAVRLPFEELTRICREYGILSVIDGAHGIGQIPLNLAELDADFFVSNCHKWLFTPRPCAVLHVPMRNQHLMRNTVPTSHLFVPKSGAYIREESRGEKPVGFVGLFQNIATFDNTPLYCVPAALDFRAQVCGSEEEIFTYIKDIAHRGADIIAKELGTFVMGEGETGTNGAYTGQRDCAMATIALPPRIGDGGDSSTDVLVSHASEVASWMQRTLTEYDTTASIFVYEHRIWVRVMGQIYLELSDFQWFANILKQLCARVQKGDAI